MLIIISQKLFFFTSFMKAFKTTIKKKQKAVTIINKNNKKWIDFKNWIHYSHIIKIYFLQNAKMKCESNCYDHTIVLFHNWKLFCNNDKKSA